MEKKRGARKIWLSIAKACAFFGAYLGAQVAVTTVFTVAYTFVSVLKLGAYDESYVLELINSAIMELTVISNAIAIFVCIVLAVVFRKRKPLDAIDMTLDFDRKGAVLGVCAILGAFGQFAILYILNVIPFPESWQTLLEENNAQITSSSTFMQILSVAIMAPLAEEIVFRAGIQGSLSRGLPKWVAIVLTSVVFGAMHGNPIGFIYATVLGILMGWIYSAFNSIIPSMVFHLAFNSTSLLLSLMSELPVAICIISIIFFVLCIGLLIFLKRLPSVPDKGDNDNENL